MQAFMKHSQVFQRLACQLAHQSKEFWHHSIPKICIPYHLVAEESRTNVLYFKFEAVSSLQNKIKELQLFHEFCSLYRRP